jgi:hypothetical protein
MQLLNQKDRGPDGPLTSYFSDSNERQPDSFTNLRDFVECPSSQTLHLGCEDREMSRIDTVNKPSASIELRNVAGNARAQHVQFGLTIAIGRGERLAMTAARITIRSALRCGTRNPTSKFVTTPEMDAGRKHKAAWKGLRL